MTLLQMVQQEQARHAAESARRLRAARDRAIGAIIWFGISLVLPPVIWIAGTIAFAMLIAALWNVERALTERYLSRIGLSYEDLQP
jgi:hypothetical protein